MASLNANDNTTGDRPSGVPWPPILLVGTVFGAIVLKRIFPLSWPGVDDLAAQTVGLSIGAMGLGLIAWALWTLSRAKTTVMPHKGSTALVTSGPFQRLRNPIYLGDAMVLLGVAELTKNIWFAILVPVFIGLVTWLAILPEERYLEKKFGDAYRAYKAKTKRWI